MFAILPCHLPLITIHISDCCLFSDIHISHGSVATYLRCNGILGYDLLQSTTESVSERNVKIGYYLGKLWATVTCLVV